MGISILLGRNCFFFLHPYPTTNFKSGNPDFLNFFHPLDKILVCLLFVCYWFFFVKINRIGWKKKYSIWSQNTAIRLLEIVETWNLDQLTWMKGSGVSSNHMSSDFFPTFWTTFTFAHIMFFTEIFAIKCVNCTNDGLFTFGTFVRSPLKKIE